MVDYQLVWHVYNSRFIGMVNEKMLQADISAFSFNMNQQFRFAKTWGAEMIGFYQSRSPVISMFLLDPMYVVSFGASMQIIKTKGSLNLASSILPACKKQKLLP